jgi:lipopolysaccharide biosynthesis glycosyltransferase
MKDRAIISLADSKYFELLNELIDSILSFEESKSVSICILDAGLHLDQIKILEKKVYKIVKAKWDIEVPEYKIKGREWLKSQVSRAFLPEYFPGFKKYLWIDADAWVNDWSAVELYFKGSDNKTLSISTSADRAYGRVLRADWIFSNIAFIRSQNYKHSKSSGFSNKICREVALKPHLNIGVFCLENDAPHWLVWQTNLKQALKKGRIFGSEQIAMNISVYCNQMKVEILPTYCNWFLIENIKFDENKNTFVEPYLPHHKIGIIHLAGKKYDEFRFDKNKLLDVQSLNNNWIKKNIRFTK